MLAWIKYDFIGDIWMGETGLWLKSHYIQQLYIKCKLSLSALEITKVRSCMFLGNL